MLLKVRQIGDGMVIPVPAKIGNDEYLETGMIGKLVRVPAELKSDCEKIVGLLTMGLYPVGVEVSLDPPDDGANGLWVQPPVLDEIRKRQKAMSA